MRKRGNFGAMSMIAALAGMTGSNIIPRRSAPQPPKNKYNLTSEEVAHMATLSPKEKKIFLKQRSVHELQTQRTIKQISQ